MCNKRLPRKITLYIFGLVDKLTLGLIRRKARNVLVFHEVSKQPSGHSRAMETHVKTEDAITLLRNLINQLHRHRLENLTVTFDDGYRIPNEILNLLRQEGIRTIFFLNASTIEFGINWDALKSFRRDSLIIPSTEVEVLKVLSDLQRDFEFLEYQGTYFTAKDCINLSRSSNFQLGEHIYLHESANKFGQKLAHNLLRRSQKIFSKLGTKPASFAWPYGEISYEYRIRLKEFGFSEIYGGALRKFQNTDYPDIARVQVDLNTKTKYEIRGALFLNRIFGSV